MPLRRPLPDSVATHPFAVRDALRVGVPAKRLRARDLAMPYWGTRTTATARLTLHRRCATLQTRLPQHAYFSHTTAALLVGAPLPWKFQRDPLLHVSVPAPSRAPNAKGIVGHQVQAQASEVIVTGGVRVSSPTRTWCDLAGILGIHDLVAVGDHLIQWRMPLTTKEELAAAVATYPGRRGRRLLRAALALLDERAESHPESVLRVILVLAGLPVPEINREVFEADGVVFARLDLRYRREKVAIEYQGDYHRVNRDQWRKDMSRRARLEALGWYVIELNADDLRDPAEVAALILSVLRARRQHAVAAPKP